MDQFTLDLKAVPLQDTSVPALAALIARLATQTNGDLPYEAAIEAACQHMATHRGLCLQVLETCLSQLLSQSMSGPAVSDLAVNIGTRCAHLFVEDGKHSEAARILNQLVINSERFWNLAPELLFRLNVQSAKQHLLARETSLAEIAMNRAVLVRPPVATDDQTALDFELAQAETLDLGGKYLEAASKWLKVSTNSGIMPNKATHMLQRAMVCVLLSPAGALRNELARTLLKDPRAAMFPVVGEILGGLIQNQIISTSKLSSLPDESRVLVEAINVHNVLILAQTGETIHLNELASLLSLEPAESESFIGQMIMQDRVRARIDQECQLVYFKSPLDRRDGPSSFDYTTREGDQVVMLARAKEMHNLSSQLDALVSQILLKHPMLNNA